MLTRIAAEIVVISTTVVYVSLLIAVNRKNVSKLRLIRATGAALGAFLAIFAILPLTHWRASTQETMYFWTCGSIFSICWSFACDFKARDIERQNQLVAGIVTKDDRVYNDWAKPDPE